MKDTLNLLAVGFVALGTYSVSVLAAPTSPYPLSLSRAQQELLQLTVEVASNEESSSELKFITQIELNDIIHRMLNGRLSTRELLEAKESLRMSRPADLDYFQHEDAINALREIIEVRGEMDQHELLGRGEYGALKCWFAIHADPTRCLSPDSPEWISRGNGERMIVGFCDSRTNDGRLFRASRSCAIREVSSKRVAEGRVEIP